ncbi:MAG: hypothetical protein WD669_01980 [Pirellulales bacterium]
MSTRANVHSSEAIERVRIALLSFVEQVADALTGLDSEMRRVQDWIEHDRPRHWRAQIHQATDQLNKAQAGLHRCLMFPTTMSERPSCYEERLEVKRAQARQEYCHAKAERVRHWMRALQHEVFEYEGRISQMVRLVEVDVPQAIGVLERILRHLDEYQSIRAAEPQAAYNDLAVAEEIWPEEKKAPAETATAGEPASAGGQQEPN